MPTGRAVKYMRYTWEQLKDGVVLDPPEEALRAYISVEVGQLRWAFSNDQKIEPRPHLGFPLEAGWPEEFDTDLKYLNLWAGSQDTIAHVYYFRSA